LTNDPQGFFQPANERSILFDEGIVACYQPPEVIYNQTDSQTI